MRNERRDRSPEEIARLGDEIYERAIRKKVERKNHGQVVAIDVNSEQFEIGKNALTACQGLLARVPDAEIWVVRVGYRTLYHFLGLRSSEVPRSEGQTSAQAAV